MQCHQTGAWPGCAPAPRVALFYPQVVVPLSTPVSPLLSFKETFLRSFFHGNIIKMMLCTFSELPRHGTVLPRRQPCLPGCSHSGWSLSFPSLEAAATSHRHPSQVPSSPCAFLAPALVYLTPNILLPLWKVTGEISWKKELLRAVSCSWGCTKPRDGCNHPRPAWRSWAEASPSLAGFSWCR